MLLARDLVRVPHRQEPTQEGLLGPASHLSRGAAPGERRGLRGRGRGEDLGDLHSLEEGSEGRELEATPIRVAEEGAKSLNLGDFF